MFTIQAAQLYSIYCRGLCVCKLIGKQCRSLSRDKCDVNNKDTYLFLCEHVANCNIELMSIQQFSALYFFIS